MTCTTNPIPQTIAVTGRPYGSPPACTGCGQPIDTSGEYSVLLDGSPLTRCAVLAAAHPGRWNDTIDDYDRCCETALRVTWERKLDAVGVDVLRLGQDGGGSRFFVGDTPIHAGTPIEVLGLDGTWLAGRFEYETRTTPWQALLYLSLGGWDAPSARIFLPTDTVVRVTDR